MAQRHNRGNRAMDNVVERLERRFAHAYYTVNCGTAWKTAEREKEDKEHLAKARLDMRQAIIREWLEAND